MTTYLIDDDYISLYLTEQVLRMEGFATNVLTFNTAEKALTSLRARMSTAVLPGLPQLIFLDLNMPVMDGWDFLKALEPHERELHGRCRIYLLTSSLAQADTAKAKDYSLVSGIIHKPLDEDEVRAIWAEMSEDNNNLLSTSSK